MSTQPIAPSDLTWLNMDQPTNLMVVNGLMWFHEVPDWDAVRSVVQTRLVDRYEVLHQRPLREGRKWVWTDDREFALDRHMREVTLPSPGDQATLQAVVSERFSQPPDRNHPLWEMDLISGYTDPTGKPGAVILARFHHALADGIRIVQLVLGMCDSDGDAMPPVVGRESARQHPIAKAAGVGRKVASDVTGAAGSLVSAAARSLPKAASAVTSMSHETIRDGVGLVMRPTRITDAVSGTTDEDNLTANTWRSTARLTLWGRDSRLVADQAPGVAKRVSWVEGLDLDVVKGIGRAHGATVNDVLLSAVSLGLTHYLEERGRTGIDEADFLVPISLKPVDASLPAELGNHFAMVMFPMPIGLTEPDALLAEVHARMTRIKNSAEAMLIFGMQRAVAVTPSAISERLTAYVADKTVGVLTNVPGPREPISLAGTTVAGVLGFVPAASDQNLGLCILSYAGTVNVGVSADAGIIPDPNRLAGLIYDAVEELAGAAA